MTNENLHFELRRSVFLWVFVGACSIFAGLITLKRAYWSGSADHTTWIWLILGLNGVLFAISQFRTKRIIRIEDDVILIGSSKGKSPPKLEPITSIDRDQVAYHLYSKKYDLSVKMKRLPEGVRVLFDERCGAGSA